MDFFKKNGLLIGISVLFILLLSGSVFLLVRQIDRRKAAEDERTQMIAKREEIWKRPTFPSEENIEKMKANKNNISALSARVLDVFQQGSLSFEPIEGIKCKQEIIVACQRMSELLDQNGIQHPTRYQFGFERYAQPPPRKEDTPILQKQLKIIEELVKLGASAPFQELLSIRRVEFEEPSATKSGSNHSPSSKPPEPLIALRNEFIYLDSSNYIYSIMPFELEFTCDSEALRHFLNALTSSPFILIPRIISIENEKKEVLGGKKEALSKSISPKVSGRSLPRETVAKENHAKGEIVKMDPTDLPYVMGGPDEKIKVSLRTDWLEFRKQVQAAK